jgi:glycosyltransferase involved in cell wall biosynthesis
MSPTVSILIPCYNAERWIAQAIQSALAQTWAEKEVIVVDDGSTDRSLDVIQQFDGRIRWETGSNRGGGAARNRLLELACGEWLQYLDADDYLLPDKLARQVEFLRHHPDRDVIYSPVKWKRLENGAVICTDTPIPEPRDPWILLALWHLPQTGGTLWKKRALERVGGWRVDQPCCQEHELYCRLLENNARFEYCAGCLAVYRDLDDPARITRKLQDEFIRQRLLVLERIESHLNKSSQLTQARCQAINNARHELARRLWRSDRLLASLTYQRILASDSAFVPTVMPASPLLYSIAFRVLGFEGAQFIASYVRVLKQGFRLRHVL